MNIPRRGRAISRVRGMMRAGEEPMRVQKNEILEAACRIVLDRGLAHLSAKAVAAEVGISVDELETSFPSLGRLTTEAFDFADSRATAHVMEGLPEISALDRLVHLLTGFLDDSEEVRADWVFWIEMEAASVFDKDVRSVVSERVSNWRMTVSSLIGVAQREGSVPADVDADLAGDRLVLIQDSIGRLRAMGMMGQQRALSEIGRAIDAHLSISSAIDAAADPIPS